MNRVKRLLFEHFEVTLVVVLTLAAGYTVLVSANKLAFLNFFYIPVLLAAYFLGRRLGVLAGFASVLMISIYAVLDPVRFVQNAGDSAMLSVFLWGAFLMVTAYVVGTLYDLKTESTRDLHQAYQGIVEILAKFIDAVDGYTQDHSVRVSQLATKIATELGLDRVAVENIRVAGLLHDVGKIDVSLEVLTKASALAPHEWEEMKRHTSMGSELLEQTGGLLRDVLPIVHYHHEYFDGTGYHGVSGKEIPLGARILAVADAYDAMITDRPYRTGRTPWEAKVEIESHSGKQFDPKVVDAFIVVMRDEIKVA